MSLHFPYVSSDPRLQLQCKSDVKGRCKGTFVDYSHSFPGFSYLLFILAYILKTGHFPYIFLRVLYSIQARVAKSVAITQKECLRVALMLPDPMFSAAVAIP